MEYSLQRLKRIACLRLLSYVPLHNKMRVKLCKWGGVRLASSDIYIGDGVIFDSLYPEEIFIGKHVHITMGTIILTHCLDTHQSFGVRWQKGHVEIGDYTFIGARTIICNHVKIGKNCIIGAGSIVTKDIPDNEIWAGNPARMIKVRNVAKSI